MRSFFFLFYTVTVSVLYVCALPLVAMASFLPKYRNALPARFWLQSNPPFAPGGVWFHTCSLGEANAIAPLVRLFPPEEIRLSTITQTGKAVHETYGATSRYLPFEPLLFVWQRRHKVLVVFEAELWYLLFFLAKRHGTRTMLVNARISERSFPKYRRFAWLYRRIFAHIDEIYAQTDEDKARLVQLGATHVYVTGNIKLACIPKPTRDYVKPSALVVCGASTHEGEETLILEAFRALKRKEPHAVLLLAPRHPERFESVFRLAQSWGNKEKMRTVSMRQEGLSDNADVIIIDMLGELVNCMAVSDVVVMGGSFVPVGGHNAAEAAQFGCRIVSGPHTYNQRDVYAAIEGIVTVESYELEQRLCAYDTLPPTSLKAKADIRKVQQAIVCAYKGA